MGTQKIHALQSYLLFAVNASEKQKAQFIVNQNGLISEIDKQISDIESPILQNLLKIDERFGRGGYDTSPMPYFSLAYICQNPKKFQAAKQYKFLFDLQEITNRILLQNKEITTMTALMDSACSVVRQRYDIIFTHYQFVQVAQQSIERANFNLIKDVLAKRSGAKPQSALPTGSPLAQSRFNPAATPSLANGVAIDIAETTKRPRGIRREVGGKAPRGPQKPNLFKPD